MTSAGVATARVAKTRAMRTLSCIFVWRIEHWGQFDWRRWVDHCNFYTFGDLVRHESTTRRTEVLTKSSHGKVARHMTCQSIFGKIKNYRPARERQREIEYPTNPQAQEVLGSVPDNRGRWKISQFQVNSLYIQWQSLGLTSIFQRSDPDCILKIIIECDENLLVYRFNNRTSCATIDKKDSER